MAGARGLFGELRRRNVWRAAALYLGAVWALAQGIAQLGPPLGAPDWLTRWFVVAAGIGFPLWIAFAWFYALTPEGIRRESEVEPEDSIAHATGRKLDRWIIGVLAVAVVLLLTNSFVDRKTAVPVPTPATAATQSAPAISPKSIAVLPFDNLSADKANEYFVVGMQDEILTRLANLGQLKVISRTSTERYKSRPENLKQVAAELGVANIVEGSVQRADGKVRIIVQLIEARTDTHLWSQTYDRDLDDVFAVQSDVAGQIASALKVELLPRQARALAQRPTSDNEAYDLFLRGEYAVYKGYVSLDPAMLKQAVDHYKRAVSRDPGFALALARLSYTQSLLGWLGGSDVDAARINAAARANAEHALALQPQLADAHFALGYCAYYGRNDYPAALAAFGRALELRPNDANAMAATAYVLRRQGKFAEAAERLEAALVRDPRNARVASNLASTNMFIRRYAQAERQARHALALDPDNTFAKGVLQVAVLYRTGDVDQALALVTGDTPAERLARAGLLTYQRRFAEAIALVESIPDTPDNFSDPSTPSRSLVLARFHDLAGEAAQAAPLYAQAREDLLREVEATAASPANQAFALSNLASVEAGLGKADAALKLVSRAQRTIEATDDAVYGESVRILNAFVLVQARRADLAVPLLDAALSSPGGGRVYAPVLLRIDPALDPIRDTPQFKTLLATYPDPRKAVAQ